MGDVRAGERLARCAGERQVEQVPALFRVHRPARQRAQLLESCVRKQRLDRHAAQLSVFVRPKVVLEAEESVGCRVH